MHEVLVNRLGGLSLPRKSVGRLTDRPDMTLDVYRGRKTTKQQKQQKLLSWMKFQGDNSAVFTFASNTANSEKKEKRQCFWTGFLLQGSKQKVTEVVSLSKNYGDMQVPILVVVLLFYVHCKHLRSCRDSQLT